MDRKSGKPVERLERQADIPQLPPAARACLDLVGQEEPKLAAVTDAISAEPRTAERIIALANSELFTRQRRSTNLRQALINLGINESLVLSAACNVFDAIRMLPSGSINLDTFARRACITATWGKILGNEFGRRDSAQLLLTAMIQDTGRLLIAQGAPQTYRDIDPLATDRSELVQIETQALRTNHRQVSAWLASTWQLPEKVARTLRRSPDLAVDDVDDQERGFCRAVNFCGDLTEVWCGPSTAQRMERITADAQRYLGIGSARLAELFNTLASTLPNVETTLGLETNEPEKFNQRAQQLCNLIPPSNLRTFPAAQTSFHLHPRTQNSKISSATPAPLDRKSFSARVEQEFMLSVRHEWPLSLLLIEIDDFTQVKEQCGSEGAAQARTNIAELLGRCLRSTDVTTIEGDDRFLILLPGSDTENAAAVAKRLVGETRSMSSPDPSTGSHRVTVSLGVATLDEDTPFSCAIDLRAAATVALEHSTLHGRDRHTAYSSIKAA